MRKGEFLWPGFGENSRVLKWIFERTQGNGKAVKTAIGYLPTVDALDTSGLSVTKETMQKLLSVDTTAWKEEATELRNYFALFGDKLPAKMKQQLDGLDKRLS